MHALMFVAVVALAIGIVTVESAGYPITSGPRAIDGFYYFRGQVKWAILGLLIMLGLPGRKERTFDWMGIGGLAVFAALMVEAITIGGPKNGNASWTTQIGPIPPMQPSEIAKVMYAVVAAILLGQKRPESLKDPQVLQFLGVTVAVGGLLLLQKDIGMLMVFGILFLTTLLMSGLPMRLWALVAGASAVAGAGALAMRWDRIEAWRHPLDHLNGSGYHILNSLIAISRGAGRGLGVGQSPDKWFCLPFPHTDSIFCVLAAETGLWGVGILLVVFGAMAYLTYLAAEQARTRKEWMLATTCGFLVCVQAAINMAVTTNLLPPTGLTLPFISYGGSSLVGSALAVAVVLWVAARGKGQRIPMELA
jgi:cell division protein FtsW